MHIEENNDVHSLAAVVIFEKLLITLSPKISRLDLFRVVTLKLREMLSCRVICWAEMLSVMTTVAMSLLNH